MNKTQVKDLKECHKAYIINHYDFFLASPVVVTMLSTLMACFTFNQWLIKWYFKHTFQSIIMRHFFPSFFLPFVCDMCGSLRIKCGTSLTCSGMQSLFPMVRLDSKSGKLVFITITDLWVWPNSKTMNLYISFDSSTRSTNMLACCCACILLKILGVVDRPSTTTSTFQPQTHHSNPPPSNQFPHHNHQPCKHNVAKTETKQISQSQGRSWQQWLFGKRKGGMKNDVIEGQQRVVVEDWLTVKEQWESGETPVPEEVISVEELDEDNKKNKK